MVIQKFFSTAVLVLLVLAVRGEQRSIEIDNSRLSDVGIEIIAATYENGYISYVIKNDSGKDILVWIAGRSRPNVVSHTYFGFGGLFSEPDRIADGEVKLVRVRDSDRPERAFLAAVMFADGSTAGDRALCEELLGQREGQVRALAELEFVLTEALTDNRLFLDPDSKNFLSALDRRLPSQEAEVEFKQLSHFDKGVFLGRESVVLSARRALRILQKDSLGRGMEFGTVDAVERILEKLSSMKRRAVEARRGLESRTRKEPSRQEEKKETS